MDVIDGGNEISVSSLISNSIDSQQKEVISLEDLAWVDSCLIEDNDILESDWNPVKNALLEIIGSTPESFNTDGGADIETLPSGEENKNARFQGTGNDFSPVSIAAERSTDGISEEDNMAYTLQPSTIQEYLMPISDDKILKSNHIDLELNLSSSTYDMELPSVSSSTYNVLPLTIAAANTDNNTDEKTETLPSLTFQGNPFLPTYNEDLKENETIDSGLSMDSSAYDMEQSSDDIFKIWDLNIPSEEGELVKQLKKAMATNSFQMTSSSFDDSEQLKVLKEESLDNLIAGIADLSLNQDAS